jgi:preprotein translocase subunit YajC
MATLIPVTAPLAAAKSSSGSSFTLIIILVLVFGLFYFLMIRPQRNRQRQVVQVQNAVVPGQRVRTTAGMYGTVTAVDDGDVVVEIAPGVEVRYLKRAIMEVLSDAPVNGTGNGAQPAADVAAGEAAARSTQSAADADAAHDGQAAEK